MLYQPALHDVHTSEVDAAARLPYMPATQAVHAAEEVAFARLLYLPALQLAQKSMVEFNAKYVPGAHAGQGYLGGYEPGSGTLETARTREF